MPDLPEPLVLHVIPEKMRGPGRGAVGLGVFLTGVCGAVAIHGAAFPAFFLFVLILGLLLLVLGLFNLLIARRRPVALRIDRHGISGYYVPVLNWSDIRRVGPTEAKGGTLGIELVDLDAVRRRVRSPMMRLNLSLPKGDTWHLVVPGDVLDTDLGTISGTAEAFLAAARAGGTGT